jgi:hypothetical protein
MSILGTSTLGRRIMHNMTLQKLPGCPMKSTCDLMHVIKDGITQYLQALCKVDANVMKFEKQVLGLSILGHCRLHPGVNSTHVCSIRVIFKSDKHIFPYPCPADQQPLHMNF